MQLYRLAPAADETSAASFDPVRLVLLALPLLALVWVLVTSRRRQREADARQAALAVGDRVITASGLLGTLVGLDAEVARLEIAPGVVVEIARPAVVSTVPAVAPATTDAHPGGSTAVTTVQPKEQ